MTESKKWCINCGFAEEQLEKQLPKEEKKKMNTISLNQNELFEQIPRLFSYFILVSNNFMLLVHI